MHREIPYIVSGTTPFRALLLVHFSQYLFERFFFHFGKSRAMKGVIFFHFRNFEKELALSTALIFFRFFFFTKTPFQNFENEKKLLFSLPYFRQNEKKFFQINIEKNGSITGPKMESCPDNVRYVLMHNV